VEIGGLGSLFSLYYCLYICLISWGFSCRPDRLRTVVWYLMFQGGRH